MSQETTTVRYGIEAPGVIRKLALIGMVCLCVALLRPPVLHLGAVDLDVRPSFLPPALSLLAGAALMLFYALHGKFAHREQILGHDAASGIRMERNRRRRESHGLACIWQGESTVESCGRYLLVH